MSKYRFLNQKIQLRFEKYNTKLNQQNFNRKAKGLKMKRKLLAKELLHKSVIIRQEFHQ